MLLFKDSPPANPLLLPSWVDCEATPLEQPGSLTRG